MYVKISKPLVRKSFKCSFNFFPQGIFVLDANRSFQSRLSIVKRVKKDEL